MNLDFLRPLYDTPEGGGRYVSVYLPASRASQRAASEIPLRWRAARDRLAAEGADQATLDAIQDAVTDPAQQAPGRALFGRSGAVRLDDCLPEPPRAEISRCSPLPHVMPLLAQRAPRLAHVRVAVDRSGGEVIGYAPDGEVSRTRTGGDSWPVHHVSAGGWHPRRGAGEWRYQRSAEETWADNAKQTADAVASTANRVGARFIVLAGDVKARPLLLSNLGKALRDCVVVVGRQVAADSQAVADAAAGKARQLRDKEDRARLEALRERLAAPPPFYAVQGLAATLAALRDGLASDVLVADDPCLAATAWVGDGLADVAAAEPELGDRGVEHLVTDRADAALVKAMAATGAELRFMPEDEPPPREPVAALLRAPVPGAWPELGGE